MSNDNQLADDFVEVFGTEAGRRVIAHLREQFEVGLPIFVSKDFRRIDDPAIDAAVKDGNHEVIRHIETTLTDSYNQK